MAFGNVIKYRIKTRGRPREFNIDKAISDLYEAESKAADVLREIRETSKGYRSERILGSSTTAPAWVEESLDLLEGAKYGRDLSVQEIKQIRQTTSELRQLGSASRRYSAQGRARLVERISEDYQEALSGFAKSGRQYTKQEVAEIQKRLSEMTPREKGEFFFSQHYQDPKKYERYKKVQAWAQADTGLDLTMQESWAHLFNRRMADGLD